METSLSLGDLDLVLRSARISMIASSKIAASDNAQPKVDELREAVDLQRVSEA